MTAHWRQNPGERDMSSQISETELYAPVKAFLEAQGYEVKAEVGPADVVAASRWRAPVIVELKTGFSLALFHQGIARLSVCDDVYLAVPRGTGRRFQRALAENTRLARRLGLGLMTVRLETGLVEVHCDPGPYAPRKSVRRSTALLSANSPAAGRSEHRRHAGGAGDGLPAGRAGLRGASGGAGACKGAAVRDATGVARATTIMRDNHYGWFRKVDTGVYALSDAGAEVVHAENA
jgi:hypothetical protein